MKNGFYVKMGGGLVCGPLVKTGIAGLGKIEICRRGKSAGGDARRGKSKACCGGFIEKEAGRGGSGLQGVNIS